MTILEQDFVDIFQEPEDFRPPPPKPTSFTFDRDAQATGTKDISQLKFSLVGHHSLWAHVLWNSGIHFARYIDQHPEMVRGKNVLELGAGAALPSMVSILNGAQSVVVTEYPEDCLISNLKQNIGDNLSALPLDHVSIQGFLWGSDVQPLLQCLGEDQKFQVVIMCDLVFSHNQHRNMLKSVYETLSDDGTAICAFSHHRTWLIEEDKNFLKLAEEEYGFTVELLDTTLMNVMFEKDSGDETVRKTVFVYAMKKSRN